MEISWKGKVTLDQLQPQPLSTLVYLQENTIDQAILLILGTHFGITWRGPFLLNDGVKIGALRMMADSTLAALRVVVYPCSIVLQNRFFNHMHGFL